ncbi:uncharacterized protein LOC113386422 [Ctenocephalides felis]|uniref:uncharacterized protein LOC113386422 n=1 Tax=Ctenocephalides felis TaxID=7515 RepID=UPI000E6E2BFA|nr:uncharacterized protein LOC113386422 [Ctenocephalides felis]
MHHFDSRLVRVLLRKVKRICGKKRGAFGQNDKCSIMEGPTAAEADDHLGLNKLHQQPSPPDWQPTSTTNSTTTNNNNNHHHLYKNHQNNIDHKLLVHVNSCQLVDGDQELTLNHQETTNRLGLDFRIDETRAVNGDGNTVIDGSEGLKGGKFKAVIAGTAGDRSRFAPYHNQRHYRVRVIDRVIDR